MNTWVNGEKGSVVKQIIDENFDILDKRISQTSSIYTKEFTASDWSSGVITIKNSEYNRVNPYIELYIKNGDNYSAILGGYIIKTDGIELQSDMPYEGKVVIR